MCFREVQLAVYRGLEPIIYTTSLTYKCKTQILLIEAVDAITAQLNRAPYLLVSRETRRRRPLGDLPSP